MGFAVINLLTKRPKGRSAPTCPEVVASSAAKAPSRVRREDRKEFGGVASTGCLSSTPTWPLMTGRAIALRGRPRRAEFAPWSPAEGRIGEELLFAPERWTCSAWRARTSFLPEAGAPARENPLKSAACSSAVPRRCLRCTGGGSRRRVRLAAAPACRSRHPATARRLRSAQRGTGRSGCSPCRRRSARRQCRQRR